MCIACPCVVPLWSLSVAVCSSVRHFEQQRQQLSFLFNATPVYQHRGRRGLELIGKLNTKLCIACGQSKQQWPRVMLNQRTFLVCCSFDACAYRWHERAKLGSEGGGHMHSCCTCERRSVDAFFAPSYARCCVVAFGIACLATFLFAPQMFPFLSSVVVILGVFAKVPWFKFCNKQSRA